MRAFLSIWLTALGFWVWGAAPVATFTQNKGQWPVQVLYRARVPGGALFVERSAFTFVQFSDSPLRHHGHSEAGIDHQNEGKAHAYRVHFEGGQAQAWTGSMQRSHVENYFTGTDPAHWGAGCGIFGEVLLANIWPGIDMRISGKDGIKYEFIVAPGADPDLIKMRYEGQDGIVLKDGDLRVTTSAGAVIEKAPISWERFFDGTDNKRIPARSSYRLQGNLLSFDVAADGDLPLVIDPVLTFGSYSGSTADNFGCTATYDGTGHLYGGGIVFNTGYPITLGALQDFWAGGSVDVGISKWTPDGSALVWSTYLGGSGAESPHSLVVNDQNELYVMGTTGSANFPVTTGAFDGSFATGSAINWVGMAGGYGFSHSNGCDLFVAHFNADATGLVGSTYMGGAGSDGLNNSLGLMHNYGDHFRGEIALDLVGNPVVATSTFSTGLPVTPGAPQAASAGGSDGYIFRLDPALTTLLWATYIGGSDNDSAYGIQFASNGEMFVAGGTNSTNLPTSSSSADNSQNGDVDGYLVHYSATGNVLIGATYIGTPAYDQCYLVQLDTNDDVYVVGQTHGAFPVTPGKYVNPGSAQFIQKFTNDLSTALWSTVIGNGNTLQNMSPTAFLVSDCGQIYVTGWAGTVNANAGNSSSTCTGNPTSADAFQSTTNGSDFYLMVLEAEGTALNYGTFFGGSTSPEHVDGGTSRFDKNGTVYHAVCAGCGGHDDFPTTPGAWSNTNNSSNNNCNLGVFKFDLSQAQAIIGIDGPSAICLGSSAQFTNNSLGGTDYFWNFGENNATSTDQAPSHTYDVAGDFVVTMILTDSSGCVTSDTAQINITVIPPPTASIDPLVDRCPGASAQLQAYGGGTYAWSPATGLSATNIANPVATTATETTYEVVVTAECGSDTADVDITFFDLTATAGPDASACLGNNVGIGASGGAGYLWEPAATLSDATLAAPIASPDTTTTYTVTITTVEGCTVEDTLVVVIYDDQPQAVLEDTVICAGRSVQLIADAANTYSWRPANGITTLDIRNPLVTPTVSTLYIVDIVNNCGPLTDSAFVELVFVFANAWPDTLVCPGVPLPLNATGGSNYQWSPAVGLNSDTIPNPIAIPPTSTGYTVVVSDELGCTDTAFAQLDLRPWPTVEAGPDRLIEYGDIVQLTATGSGVLTWGPQELIGDSSVAPFTRPEESTTYTVTVTDPDGCKNTDVIVITVTGSLYVPNTFTPNGDGYNDGFGAWGKDIRSIELLVFNRWGELIWSTDELTARWDGTYNGVDSPIDTYVWRLKALELSGRERSAIGHVNLVR